ncbi:hypothetical protein Chor_013523, partial [Crotalus horridus]
PQNGSLILYNRKKVKYRKDGYCWKKRKDGKTTREDHMKLKVKGVECLYGCYVHSSIVPTFHRRCYWLLQNPDIVLVHYLNVPAIEDCGKVCSPVLCSINSDRKEWLKWSKEELVGQLKPISGDQVDVQQQREQQHRPLCGAAGAADLGKPPGQAAPPDPRLPLQQQPRSAAPSPLPSLPPAACGAPPILREGDLQGIKPAEVP